MGIWSMGALFCHMFETNHVQIVKNELTKQTALIIMRGYFSRLVSPNAYKMLWEVKFSLQDGFTSC